MESFFSFAILLLLLFLPAIVAYKRKHRNAGAIFVMTLGLGWTIVGWIVALIWALNGKTNQVNTGMTGSPFQRSAPTSGEERSLRSMALELTYLIKLRDAGELTPDEFEHSKARLLN